MSDHVAIKTPTLVIAKGTLGIAVTGFRYHTETLMNFGTVHINTPGMGMDFTLYLTPSECGALAERLLAVKAGIEDAAPREETPDNGPSDPQETSRK